ncbi:ATP-binding protein [Neobacillus sp. PS3-40]|uniref:sensor histidine kinase n=1 Tax=Neobacillus sp. PS3-40 TaxID=3070679 RepID=UPI0027DF8157|nr:ATP-binding protein [Neobacillus sp. PS3-40]WML43905.1 ATP-binding protein [Neobacillus sp. PS3-40]
MIIGILICTIGIIPIVLALGIKRIYKGTKLSLSLFIYMLLITIWQEDIGILYFKDLFNQDVILNLFRLCRIALIYGIPVVFYVAYVIMNQYSTTFKSDTILNKLLNFVFTKKILYLLLIWSSIIYIINWTDFGIKGLKVVKVTYSPVEFYFPIYGSISWVFMVHMSSFILFFIFLFLISWKIHNTSVKNFLSTFSICSFLLFLTGFINFSPTTGAIASSIGVIIFSVIIMFSFIKMNHDMTIKYNQVVERQKKLDYTGNLAGSLIHEIKNTNQVITGFAKMLEKSHSLSEFERGSLEMILKGAKQTDDLANNYREYMKNSKMEFRIEELNEIIEEAIEFSKELTKDKQIDIEFISEYTPLKSYINRTYMQQVFINLIKNSSEAIPLERETRKIKINIDLYDDFIAINFYDTGQGIAPENWESIFDPFMSSKEKGMGLGLPFVKKIIFEHRGDIIVANSSPAGTHFQIRIPQFEMSNI